MPVWEGPVSEAGLPCAWERVLNIWAAEPCIDPRAVTRARRSLEILFGDLINSPDPDRFRRSTLTMTGSPFEPAFSSLAPGVRYTVDPAPYGVCLRERLDYALSVLSKLNAPVAPGQLIRRLATMQSTGELRYGSQIGARHGASDDSYKLYVEIPPEAALEADVFGEELLGSPPVLNVPGRNARPSLAGIDLTSGRIELYYRIENLHPLEIRTLLSRADAGGRAEEMLALLAESQPRPILHELPGATWGFSYSRDIDGAMTFTIYTFARTLFGPDGWVRDAVLGMGRRHGWKLTGYPRMSEPLAGRRGFRCHHGIIGLVARPGCPLAAWIGLAPPGMGA
jgi:hypothetical protein